VLRAGPIELFSTAASSNLSDDALPLADIRLACPRPSKVHRRTIKSIVRGDRPYRIIGAQQGVAIDDR